VSSEDVDIHPVSGSVDPTSLVTMPRRYKTKFVPRDEEILKKVLAEFKPLESGGICNVESDT